MFKKKKTYIILAIVVVIVAGVILLKPKKSAVQYTTTQATVGNLARTVSVSGILETENQIDLSFKTSGRIQYIKFKIGDQIKKGNLVAKIENGTLDQQRQEAAAALKIQKRTYYLKRDKHNTYNKQEREIQKASVDQAQAGLDVVNRQIAETYLYAPIGGTIIRKNYEVGENVAANAAVVSISENTDPLIKSNVPESDIVDIKIGQKAELSFDSLPSDEKFSAVVSEIEPASTVIQDVVYYKVTLKLDGSDERLKLGMSADIDVNTAQKDKAVMIPQRAVKTEGDKKYVEILKSENMTEKVFVETGLSGDDGMVEIVSGLKGGENVVTLTKAP